MRMLEDIVASLGRFTLPLTTHATVAPTTCGNMRTLPVHYQLRGVQRRVCAAGRTV